MNNPFDEFHQDVLIQEIVKNNYIICGDTHQNFAIWTRLDNEMGDQI